jgi:hypothetical protein
MTGQVVRWDGLLPATPRTFDGASALARLATTHGFIARANSHLILQVFKRCKPGVVVDRIKRTAYSPTRLAARG